VTLQVFPHHPPANSVVVQPDSPDDPVQMGLDPSVEENPVGVLRGLGHNGRSLQEGDSDASVLGNSRGVVHDAAKVADREPDQLALLVQAQQDVLPVCLEAQTLEHGWDEAVEEKARVLGEKLPPLGQSVQLEGRDDVGHAMDVLFHQGGGDDVVVVWHGDIRVLADEAREMLGDTGIRVARPDAGDLIQDL